jgi:two-component system sensor histidine kinase YesM
MAGNRIVRTYITIFLVLIAIPILLILFLLNNMYADTLINISAEERQLSLDNISTSVGNEMRQRRLAAINVAVNFDILQLANQLNSTEEGPSRYMLAAEMRARLNQPILLINENETIAFYFRNSDNMYTFGEGAVLLPEEAREAPWHTAALENSGRLITDPSMRYDGGRAAVTFAIHPGPLIPNNDVEVIYFRFFVNFIRDYNLDGNTLIVSQEGDIIFSSLQHEVSNNILGMPSSVQTIEGEQVLVTTAAVPSTDWRIIHIDHYGQILDQVGGITVYGYLAGGLYLLFFVLFSILFYKKIVKPSTMLELQAMQYQITPHFIINTMNSIKIMAMISRQGNIEKMTESFMRLLSAILGKKGTQSSVSEEIENIKHYIHIMKVRFGEKFDVEYEIDPEILDLTILSFLLQPVVENSIIHGFNEMDIGCMIYIKGYRKKDRLFLEIRDNGMGMTQEKAQKVLSQNQKNGKGFLSMGVYNVNRRIRLNYGRSYGLSIKSGPDGHTSVIFELPAIQIGGDSK